MFVSQRRFCNWFIEYWCGWLKERAFLLSKNREGRYKLRAIQDWMRCSLDKLRVAIRNAFGYIFCLFLLWNILIAFYTIQPTFPFPFVPSFDSSSYYKRFHEIFRLKYVFETTPCLQIVYNFQAWFFLSFCSFIVRLKQLWPWSSKGNHIFLTVLSWIRSS